MQEKSLRTGSAADAQFEEFVEPENATIKVEISSDVRQVGKLRLMQQFGDFLRSKGYTNVTMTDTVLGYHPEVEQITPSGPNVIEMQKKVHIDLRML